MQPEHGDAPTLLQLSSTQEEKVGIICLISSGPPILAVSKYMLTDFIVNEIDLSGKLVKIAARPDYSLCKALGKQEDKAKIDYQIGEQLKKEIMEVLGSHALNQISSLYQNLEAGDKINKWQTVLDGIPDSKEERTKMHFLVREKLHNIESTTLENNRMKLRYNTKLKKVNPAMRSKYIHFKLFKSNIDTMGAIFRLSKIIGVSQKLFSTAGLKDKRGVTTQLASLFNTQKDILLRFYQHADKNREIWIEGFDEGMVDKVGVGDLYGNQFGLILRLLQPSDQQHVAARVDSLREKGMINYFGMQRFGSHQTHMTGWRVLKSKWKEAVEQLLLEDVKDQSINQLKRECYENKEYSKAQKLLPKKYKNEKILFKGLHTHGPNFQNIFESLPRSLKTLFCHSLQSYIWNRIVTRRIQTHGAALVVGDLVGQEMSGFKLAKATVEEQQRQREEFGHEKDMIVGEDNADEDNEEEQEEKYEVIVVTPQNIQNFSVFDIVMPLYGCSLDIPAHSIADQFVKDELAALDLSEDDFRPLSKAMAFKGAYRRLIVRPKYIDYKFISHRSVKEELQSAFYVNGEQMKIEEGPLKAVQITLQLPKSSYATMALRQILHIPSSFQAQIALNKMYEELEKTDQPPEPFK